MISNIPMVVVIIATVMPVITYALMNWQSPPKSFVRFSQEHYKILAWMLVTPYLGLSLYVTWSLVAPSLTSQLTVQAILTVVGTFVLTSLVIIVHTFLITYALTKISDEWVMR